MNKATTVLTISREFGSGGSFIGQTVAKRLGMDYADRKILKQVAEEIGLEELSIERLEEKAAGFWPSFLNLLPGASFEAPYTPPPAPPVEEEEIFQIERRIIQELASRTDAVIIGRAAFHILADHPNRISILVHAPLDWRIRRVMELYGGLDERSAKTLIETTDRKRDGFIRSVTGLGSLDDLHQLCDLCINTGRVGLEEATELVVGLVQERRKRV